jgi:hypothetical protein
MLRFHSNNTLFISLYPMNQCGGKSVNLLSTHSTVQAPTLRYCGRKTKLRHLNAYDMIV